MSPFGNSPPSCQSCDTAILYTVTQALGPSATQRASHLLLPQKKKKKNPSSNFLNLAFSQGRLFLSPLESLWLPAEFGQWVFRQEIKRGGKAKEVYFLQLPPLLGYLENAELPDQRS